MKRALQFGQSLLRTLASHLASWADRLQNILGEIPVAKKSVPGPAIAESGTVENETAVGGPPPHWVERVRQAAPQLLRPVRHVPSDEAGRALPPRRPFPAKTLLPSRPAPVPVGPPTPAAVVSNEESQDLPGLAAFRASRGSRPSKSSAASSWLRIIPAARFSKPTDAKESEPGNPSAPALPGRPAPDLNLNRTRPAPSRAVITRPPGSASMTSRPARGLAGWSPVAGSPRLARAVAGDESRTEIQAASEVAAGQPRVDSTTPPESVRPEPEAVAVGPAKWTEFSAHIGGAEPESVGPPWTRYPGAPGDRDHGGAAPVFRAEAANAPRDRGRTSASESPAKFMTAAPAWPELPSAPEVETMDEIRLLLAARERRRRLDAEQEGTLWIG